MAENETGTVMLPPAKTQEAFVHIGFAKAKLTRGRAFVLAILAGAFVALGASFMLMVRADSTLSPSVSLILGGLAFCLGLFLVLVAGAELFTGNCLMLIGALDGRYPMMKMVRKWAVVYAGNAVGALLAVALLLASGFLSMQEGSVGELAYAVALSQGLARPCDRLCARRPVQRPCVPGRLDGQCRQDGVRQARRDDSAGRVLRGTGVRTLRCEHVLPSFGRCRAVHAGRRRDRRLRAWYPISCSSRSATLWEVRLWPPPIGSSTAAMCANRGLI